MRILILSVLTIVGLSSIARAEDRAELRNHDVNEYLCGIQTQRSETELKSLSSENVTVFQGKILADNAKEAMKLFGNKYTYSETTDKDGTKRTYKSAIVAHAVWVTNIWCTNAL